MSRLSRPNGCIFYRGPSLITGKPIIAVAVGFSDSSENAKTGKMLQTYILLADVPPNVAVATGQDKDVCGGCIHRPSVAKKIGADPCYVRVGQGPLVVWRAAMAGKYPDMSPEQFGKMCAGRLLRLGSWGEPVAVPLAVWGPALKSCAGRTGYTHRWRVRAVAPWRGLLQASCDSPEDHTDAVAAGWGTFRVALPGDTSLLGSEFRCPAAKESGKVKTCETCRACDGSGSQVVILSHGSRVQAATNFNRDSRWNLNRKAAV